ncbi:MAG: YfiR family protein [Gammaproteobacteria bacterium]|nr:YfiR family protein [Gammaproteobacteria bacterium]
MIVLIFLPALSGNAALRPNLTDEYQLKAAFTLNFARLTQWPQTPNKPQEQLLICVMGNELLKSTFSIINEQNINGKQSRLKIITRRHDIKTCHILMISGIKQSNMRQIFKLSRQHNILTISELPDISQSEAVVNFIDEGNKIKFQINHYHARQSGLKISSRLLKLAQISSHNYKKSGRE